MVVIAKDSNDIARYLLTDASGNQYVLLSDGTTIAGVEESSTGLYVSRAAHYRIEHSNMWMSSFKFVDVAAGATAVLHIKVGANKNLHGHFTVMSEAKCTIEFYENPTITNDGTGLAENCLNRQTTAVSDTTCFHTPVYAPAGLLLETGMLGTVGKFDDTGGAQDSHGYWLLKKSESYLVVVTNNNAAAEDLVIAYVWHEE